MASDVLTAAQRRGIESLTTDGQRLTTTCQCGRETVVAVDGRGRAWWLCSDCLARRLSDLEQTGRSAFNRATPGRDR